MCYLVPVMLWKVLLISFINYFPWSLICVFIHSCRHRIWWRNYAMVGVDFSFTGFASNHFIVNTGDYLLKLINLWEINFANYLTFDRNSMKFSRYFLNLLCFWRWLHFLINRSTSLWYYVRKTFPKRFVLLHPFHDLKPLLLPSNHSLILHEHCKLYFAVILWKK